MNHQKPVLLWAVDPFSSDWNSQKSAAHAIRLLTHGQSREIQPVYVGANPAPNLPSGFAIELFDALREKSQDRLNEMLEGIDLKRVLPMKILTAATSSITEQVSCLLAYAGETNADGIVVGTRARTGVPRWFFGSFAESLALRSGIPVVVVNPSWDPNSGQDPREILFPTDFSNASHSVFRKLIQFARESQYSVRLFHKYFHISAPVWNSPLEAKLSYDAIYDDGLKEAERMMEQWQKEAQEREIQVTTQIDTGKGDSAAEAILEQASRKPCFIAMAGESDGLEVRFIGSVTRKVIRSAACPVWVLHA